MNSEFDVDENGLTADGYHILKLRSLISMYISNAITFVILALIFGACVHFNDMIFGKNADLGSTVLIAIFIIIAVYLIAGPTVFYRRYRYKIDDDKAEIRRGIITISHTLIPIERIHQVDVTRGPINRLFGLADVKITTAGGVATIEYLEDDVAESIASRLNECVIGLLKDRE